MYLFTFTHLNITVYYTIYTIPYINTNNPHTNNEYRKNPVPV